MKKSIIVFGVVAVLSFGCNFAFASEIGGDAYTTTNVENSVFGGGAGGISEVDVNTGIRQQGSKVGGDAYAETNLKNVVVGSGAGGMSKTSFNTGIDQK